MTLKERKIAAFEAIKRLAEERQTSEERRSDAIIVLRYMRLMDYLYPDKK